MNKYDAEMVTNMRTFEESIRFESIKTLCNARSITMLRHTLRSALDLIDRLTPVAGDGAGGQTGDVEGETRPAPEHDGLHATEQPCLFTDK